MSFVDLAMNAFRRVRFPAQTQAVDDMIGLGRKAFEKAPPETLGAFRNWNEAAEPLEKWLSTEMPKIGKDLRGSRDYFLSPDFVLPRHESGAKIINTMRDAEQVLNIKNAEALEPFEAIAKNVNAEGSTKVFRALENPSLGGGRVVIEDVAYLRAGGFHPQFKRAHDVRIAAEPVERVDEH